MKVRHVAQGKLTVRADKAPPFPWNRRISGERFKNIERVALRKLRQLDSATELRDLASPPGNRLEPLRGGRQGQHSIRINDQWRICFFWHKGDAFEVEITDYH